MSLPSRGPVDPARVLVVIPTYDEAANIESIVARVRAAVPAAHVLVVDDASPDGTGELADALASADASVHVLHRAGKAGLGKAYLAAFDWALQRDYRFVLEMDADWSHDPAYLPTLIDRASTDADLVLGSRWVAGGGTRNWGLGRRLISRGGSLYARTILGLPIRDLTGGFKCFRAEVLRAIDLPTVASTGYGFQIELTYRAIKKEFRVMEVPIVFEDRRVGQSKMSRAIVLEALAMVWKIR